MTCSHDAGGIWCSGPAKLPTPALFTRMSARPELRSTSAASASTELRSVTSHSATSALPPDLRMASAAAFEGRPPASAKKSDGSHTGQPAGDGGSNAPARAGNDCHLSLQGVLGCICHKPTASGSLFWFPFRGHANALARILQDREINRCKDKLALDETHTYNPPHRKRCLGVLMSRQVYFRSPSEWARMLL